MTDGQWQEIRDEIVGLWGSGNTQIIDRRLAVWEKRFKLEPAALVGGAVKYLERTAKHWPAVSEMHAALDAVRSRLAMARGGQRDAKPAADDMSAADWREGARALVKGANDHLRRGNPDGNPRHRWLLDLAEFWEANADRVMRGEKPAWPPPPAPGGFGQTLSRLARGVAPVDPADRERRVRHLPIDADERAGDDR